MCCVLLCVDDYSQRLQVWKNSLERLGFSVVTATTLPVAVATLQQPNVIAVLLDCKAEGLDPEKTGFHIKQRFPDKPLLVLTARSDLSSVHWLADEHVIKSEGVTRLLDIVESVTHGARRFEAAA